MEILKKDLEQIIQEELKKLVNEQALMEVLPANQRAGCWRLAAGADARCYTSSTFKRWS